jgi:hypothetical protein
MMEVFISYLHLTLHPFCTPSALSSPQFLLHIFFFSMSSFSSFIFFLIHLFFSPTPVLQAKLITTTKMITISGQIGMRPPLHCDISSPFSTCFWFTNYTNILGGPLSIHYQNIARIANAVHCHSLLLSNKNFHEFSFSIVRIVISVSNVKSLQDCLMPQL